MKLTDEAREYFRKQGSRGGKIGGPRRMVKLTAERRSAIAKLAVTAREAKRQNGSALKSTALAKSGTAPVQKRPKKKGKASNA